MALHVKNGYPRTEINQSGTQVTTVFYSTAEADVDGMLASARSEGAYSRITKSTENGIYELECVQTLNSDGEQSDKPDNAFGSLQPSLSGSLLSMPLEQHPNYRTKWNHYLFGKSSTIPSFWESATTTIIPSSSAKNYRWGSSLAERGGEDWKVVKMPTMPGVQHYTIPTYVLTETARYRSFREAAQALGGKVGRISSPHTSISVSGNRNWLCEDGRIQFDGKNWMGSYTYTLSGPGGWNNELYS